MSSILKVDTIQNTGGTTGLTIDSSGRILKTAGPYFCAYENSTGQTTAATYTVPYETALSNVGNNYNTSTSKFTAPVAGTYFFNYTCWTNHASTSRTGFYKNNAVVGNSTYPIGGRIEGGSNQLNGASIVIELAVGDTIEVKVYAGSLLNYGSNYFLGFLLG